MPPQNNSLVSTTLNDSGGLDTDLSTILVQSLV
jgi:hypothetical protein